MDSGAVRSRLQCQMRLGGLQADKQDTECTLAGLNPMLRVSGLYPILRVSGLHPMLRQRDPAQGGVTPTEPIQTLPTGGFDRLDRPLTPNLGGVVTFSHGLMHL